MACNESERSQRSRGTPRERSAADAGAQHPDASTGGEPPASMGKPVTPHAGISQEEEEGRWRVLACGVDTLDLAGYVNWGPEWHPLLTQLGQGKRQAQERDRPAFLQDTCCGPLLIWPTAKGMFRYHLEANELHCFLSRSDDAPDHTPNAYVSLKAKSLWRRGVSEMVALVSQLIRELGGTVRALKPSRADLCADFHVPGGLTLEIVRDLGVPANRKTGDIMKGPTLETFYIGSRKAKIRARIYDKGKESAKHGKEWFADVWGVEKLEDIWRVEFQLRREALKAYGVDDVPALLRCLGGIWADLATNWYSLRLKNNANTSRRTVHPFWRLVQSCAERFGAVEPVRRKLTPSGNADAHFYVSRAVKLLVGFAACRRIPDRLDALDEFSTAVGRLIGDQAFSDDCTVKLVKLNESDGHGEEGDDDIPF